MAIWSAHRIPNVGLCFLVLLRYGPLLLKPSETFRIFIRNLDGLWLGMFCMAVREIVRGEIVEKRQRQTTDVLLVISFEV